jgi:hypothetical protein
MDPVSLVVAALVAGATAGTKDTASAAIADAYAGLKALVRRRFGGEPDAESELEQIEQGGDPAALERRLEAAGVDEDLVKQATGLLERLDPDGSREGKYRVQITGGQGTVVGDNATVTMNFGE